MAHVLYRFYSATGQLLYVGITMNPAQRFRSHRDTKTWWGDVAGISIENYDTREDLENAERRAIQVEHPLHNIVRAKPKPEPQPAQPPTEEPSLANLFGPAPTSSTVGIFGGLFNLRNEAQEAHEARRREWFQAIRDCTLCDSSGYRGKSVCDHTERSEGYAYDAQRRVQKEGLHVIPGGEA